MSHVFVRDTTNELMKRFALLLCLLATFPGPRAHAAVTDDREALLIELEYLRSVEQQRVPGANIAALPLITEFYERRDFEPAWRDSRKVRELLSLVSGSSARGLNPDDYHHAAVGEAVERLADGAELSSRDRAFIEIVLTDALVRLAYHELLGKVNPYDLDTNWNFGRELEFDDPAAKLSEAIDSPSLVNAFEAIVAREWLYRQLIAALSEYRELAERGGWPSVPDGPTLRPGDMDDRLAILSARLAATGDLDVGAAGRVVDTYDEVLVAAVRRFQERHGLDADGVIGPATLQAMNVPVEDRIRQIAISLERARWVMRGLSDEFIIVNIAAFKAYLVRDRQVVWESRAQVGTPYRQTPVFRDAMKYLVFNPTWTVPYSIATRDILPQLQRNPAYLTDRRFDVRNSDGEHVDPGAIDWSRYSRGNFPFTLIQRPGPGNALGRVKFMFPNQFAVYLHDTPSRELFGRAGRAFSSGCIRIENPFELAEYLLRDDGWDRSRIDSVIDSGELTNVVLTTPVPVLLLYWTASVERDGQVHFYDDIYGRDDAVAAALAAPFAITPTRR